MSDNSPGKKMAGIKQAWADPKARKGVLLAGGVLVLVAGVSLGMAGRDRPAAAQAPASAKVVPPPPGQRDVTADTSEQYKKLVVDQDRERAEAARTNPTSVVMPTLAGFTSDDEARRREAEAAAERGRQAALRQANQQPQFQTTAHAAGAAQGPNPHDQARHSPEYKATQQYLAGVVSGAVQGAFQPVRAAGAQPGTAAQPAASAVGGSTAAAPAAPATPLIRAGEIVFGTIDIAMNSDYSGPVTATVRQGKYAGYRLIGEKALERDALVVKFNRMSPADGGPSLQVNAYAVSLGDARKFGLTGLEGETDYHIFQRYVLPAAAAFTQTYGMTAAMKGSTTVVSDGGAVGTSTPGLTSRDRANVALGAAMGPIVADITRQATRPITVSLPAQSEIGVMFASDVVPAGAAPQSAAASAAQTAPQAAGATGAAPAFGSVRPVEVPGLAAMMQQAQQMQAQSAAQSQYGVPSSYPGMVPQYAAPGMMAPPVYPGVSYPAYPR